MKILITGGFGFIGGNLISTLCSSHDLLISTRKKSIPNAFKNFDNITIIDYQNLLNDNNFPDNVDILIHLANMNYIDCEKNPLEAINFNVNNSLVIFQNAIKKNVKHIIYFSTIQVFGSQLNGTITEFSLPRPDNIYSITHKTAEDLLISCCSKNNIKYSIIRLSNSFGPPVDLNTNIWHTFVNNICLEIYTKKEIKIKSKVNQIKDFISITEVVRCINYLINNNFISNIYNLANEKSISLIEMAELIKCRYEYLFPKDVIQIKNSSDIKETQNEFRILNKNLSKIDFHINNIITDEIDKLFLFLKNNIEINENISFL